MPDATRRAARLEAGLCAACGVEPHEEGRTRCKGCGERQREQDAQRRADARKRGLCDACGKRRAAKGRGQRCNACADKYLVKQLERDRVKRVARASA